MGPFSPPLGIPKAPPGFHQVSLGFPLLERTKNPRLDRHFPPPPPFLLLDHTKNPRDRLHIPPLLPEDAQSPRRVAGDHVPSPTSRKAQRHAPGAALLAGAGRRVEASTRRTPRTRRVRSKGRKTFCGGVGLKGNPKENKHILLLCFCFLLLLLLLLHFFVASSSSSSSLYFFFFFFFFFLFLHIILICLFFLCVLFFFFLLVLLCFLLGGMRCQIISCFGRGPTLTHTHIVLPFG